MSEKDKIAVSCIRALGPDEGGMQRSAGGARFAKGEFVPPTRCGLAYNAERGMLTGFRRDAVYALLPEGRAVRKMEVYPQWHGFRPKNFPHGRRMKDAEFTRLDRMSSEALGSELAWKRHDLALRRYMRDMLGQEAASVVLHCQESVGWGVLRSLIVSPCSIDTPPVYLALAYYHYLFTPARQTTKPSRVARRLLRGKRSDLLEHNGFNPRAAKVLARIGPRDMSLETLLCLRAMLNKPDQLKLLLHMHSPITNSVLRAFQVRTTLLSASLLEEIGLRKRSVDIGGRINDIGELRHSLGLGPVTQPFKSIRQVTHMHDDLVLALNMRDSVSLARFPPPPMEDAVIELKHGDDGEVVRVNCRFLTSHEELLMHGRVCFNCSGSYGRYVSRGTTYMLEAWSQANKKDMHTVCLAKRKNGLWGLSEIEKSNHRKADPWVVKAVEQLLVTQQADAIRLAGCSPDSPDESCLGNDNLLF